jgi:hypothetical protein
MGRRCGLYALCALVVAAWQWGTDLNECRAATSLTDLFGKNNTATLTTQTLTFTFDKNDVLSSTFPQGSAPTFDTTFVETVPFGVKFSFTPMLMISGQAAQNFDVTIEYTVMSGAKFTAAGLSFSGAVPEMSDDSSNPNANASVTEKLDNGVNLNVFMTTNDKSVLSERTSQSAALPDLPEMLAVTDTGNLSIPARGGPGEGEAQITDFTNTFLTVPEPATFVNVSVAVVLIGAGMWWRIRKR